MVQANPALQEAIAVIRRTGWLDADSCPGALRAAPARNNDSGFGGWIV